MENDAALLAAHNSPSDQPSAPPTSNHRRYIHGHPQAVRMKRLPPPKPHVTTTAPIWTMAYSLTEKRKWPRRSGREPLGCDLNGDSTAQAPALWSAKIKEICWRERIDLILFFCVFLHFFVLPTNLYFVRVSWVRQRVVGAVCPGRFVTGGS